ncbi:MAG TPA: SpoIID/LytB domain-containing protein [Blastocatellia bacterium]|nr:SpoIID/LytB domain-containing protein [Blastocatellia bacterium]
MSRIEREPVIRVGLMTSARAEPVRFTLRGEFRTDDGRMLASGDYVASSIDGRVRIDGPSGVESARSIRLTATDLDACRVMVRDITIGIDFHWERREEQTFQGSLLFQSCADGLLLVNELPLESYLVSVISSEMSAACPTELLRAHAIVSRSWLLANVFKDAGRGLSDGPSREAEVRADPAGGAVGDTREIIRWYGRESHSGFDVCADDHCQRYQGITRAFSQAAFDAVRDTRGAVLMFGAEICDARYSKSCGGVSEIYGAAWEDRDVPYLASVYDGPGTLDGYPMGLTTEANAERWITSSPPAYCNTDSREMLERILPGFDQETRDFYRWRVENSNEELSDIIHSRTGVDVGRLIALEPVARGESGRIVRLRIVGEKRSIVIGKELEIRRSLSRSHLYSSAFVVRPGFGVGSEGDAASKFPTWFTLIGAGWGHGVGLCQIGAAVMADVGKSHQQILAHYFRNAELQSAY